MDSLPEDLFVDIVRRVGNTSFRHLGPFISASKASKSIVFTHEVLGEADVTEFIPNSSMANKDSIYHPFFSACVSKRNIRANHLEGLRILCQEGPSDEAFAMIQVGGVATIYTAFVTGIFQICAGEYERGMEIISDIWEIGDTLQNSVFIAEMVVSQIVAMRHPKSGLYFYSHSYPFEDVQVCVFVGCAANEVCQDCFTFWFSLIIRSLC